MCIVIARHLFHFFEAPMGFILLDVTSLFDMRGVPMALTSRMLKFVQGNKVGHDEAYVLEIIEQLKPSLNVHIIAFNT